jgi:uncharacterized Zn-binding protein involved in type VI secretion
MIISNISGLQMMVDGMPVATQMSVVRSRCGHYGVVITGSSVVKHNGIGIARRFDTGVGCYNFTIIGGATNVNTVLF